MVGVFGVCLVVCLVGAPNTGVCLVKMDQTRTKHGYQSRPIFLISSYLYTTVFSVFRKLQCLRKSVVYIWNIEFMGMYRRGGCIYARVSTHTGKGGKGSIGRDFITSDDGKHSDPTETNREQR